jgi:hypothetical protein
MQQALYISVTVGAVSEEMKRTSFYSHSIKGSPESYSLSNKPSKADVKH